MSFADTLSASSDATTQMSPAAAQAAAHRKWIAHEFPLEYWWTVTAILGVLTIINVFTRVLEWDVIRKSSSGSDTEKGGRSIPSRSTSSLSRFLDAIRSTVNILLYRITIPLVGVNLAEFIIVSAYMAGTITWALSDTTVTVESNWSSRAGMIAAVQIPFVVSLAGKNNVVSFLTGISHEKLNLIHRWAGRMVFTVGWLHVGTKLVGFADEGVSPWKEEVFRWGLVAIVALTIATATSFRVFRTLAYEVFLMIHIATIFCFILGVYKHQPTLTRFIYPGFIIWGFDRTVRIARMIYLNLISRPSVPIHHTQSAKSAMERISEDTVRLSVRRSKTSLSSWRAGQHFFIIAPGVSTLPWEAHPFTPATIPHTIGTSGSTEQDVELDFIIRGRNGFTGKLLKTVVDHEKTPGDVEPRTIIVDGPYGQPPNLGVFDTSILIAGGSGVSYTLSMLLDRIYQARLGKGRTTRVLFVWAIREISHVNWIAGALQSALDSNARHPVDLDIRIYVTQGRLDGPSTPMTLQSSDSGKEDAASEKASTPREEVVVGMRLGSGKQSTEALVEAMAAGGGSVKFIAGRPNVSEIIDQELSVSDGRRVSVDVSGPSRLADTVRSALASSPYSSPSSALRGGPSVTLHTESFGW